APGGKEETRASTADMTRELATWQERLFAEQRQALLVVLQAIDAGGKDGTVKHVFTGVNPAGCDVVSFKAPTTEELGHDFLWRVHRHTPRHGQIAVFNRSHYEDVLIVRVDHLVPEDVWRPRYQLINHFEAGLAAANTKIVKLYLHIDRDEQRRRLQRRLDDPTKRWKFEAADIDKRAQWDDYQQAFGEMLQRTSTPHAPWYVIPANHKWYRNWLVTRILLE